MRYAIYNNQIVDKAKTILNIPKIYKAVTGEKLEIKKWQADMGRIDGLDVTDWLEANGVQVEIKDSIFKV